MNITVSQKELSNALTISNRAVGVNNTLPILNNVLLKAEGKKLYFTTTNLEIAVTCSIDAEIKNEGEITIPSKILSNYVNYLKDEKVDIIVESGDGILIKTSDSKIKIKGMKSIDFPSIPVVEKISEINVSLKELKTSIHQVVFAASLNTTRPILSGVYFTLSDGKLKMVTTDSYRLAEKVVLTKNIDGEINYIIPAKTIIELGYILDTFDEDKEASLIFSKNQVLFSIDDIKFTSRLIEGQFPNYKQIIPETNKTTIEFDVQSLVLALKKINIFAKENNNKIIIKTSSNNVSITTDATQFGEGEVDIITAVNGDECEIALNSQYILDLLSNIGARDVMFKVGEKTSPVVIKEKGVDNYLHIIMPLKI